MVCCLARTRAATMKKAGFVELTHYYRPDGVPREQFLSVEARVDFRVQGRDRTTCEYVWPRRDWIWKHLPFRDPEWGGVVELQRTSGRARVRAQCSKPMKQGGPCETALAQLGFPPEV